MHEDAKIPLGSNTPIFFNSDNSVEAKITDDSWRLVVTNKRKNSDGIPNPFESIHMNLKTNELTLMITSDTAGFQILKLSCTRGK